MERKGYQIRFSPAELCLLDKLAIRVSRRGRSAMVHIALEDYAKKHHKEIYTEYHTDLDAETEALRANPAKRLKKELKELKEQTKEQQPISPPKTNDDDDD